MLAAPAISNASSVNLIVNGSFETTPTSINNGQWRVYQSILGWSSVSGSGIEVRNNVAGTAQDGSKYVELDSHNFSQTSAANNDRNNASVITNSAMEQTIQTVQGNPYLLSFYYSPRINQSALTNGISVFWNEVLLNNITQQGGSINNWSYYSFLVQGTGNDKLKFAATGFDDSHGGNIDNVSLNAVPIPAAAWLFGSALGILGLARRKQAA